MRRIIKHDLKLLPFKTDVTKNLTEDEILRRITKDKRLLRKMTIKKIDETQFTVEKITMLNPLRNPQSSRVYSNIRKKSEMPQKSLSTDCHGCRGSAMCSAGISKFGKTQIYFAKPGVKVNELYYHPHVLRYMIPQMAKF